MNEIKKFYTSNGYYLPIDVMSSDIALEASIKLERISKNHDGNQVDKNRLDNIIHIFTHLRFCFIRIFK